MNEKEKNNKKLFILIGCIVVVLILFLYLKKDEKENEGEKVEERSNEIRSIVKLETGSPVPSVKDYFEYLKGPEDDYEIEYLNNDEKIEKREELFTSTYYVDHEGNEVKKDDAFEGSEEKVLKEGYKEVVVLRGIYSYTITIKNKNDEKEIYTTKLELEDTQAPVLKVKDITITEGDKVESTTFFVSCEDNSRETCNNPYFVKEVKGEDGTVTYEKIEDVDKTVGEREILLRAEDATGNVSEVVKAKLVVKKKPETPKTTTNKNSSNKNNSTNKTTNSGTSTSNKTSESNKKIDRTPASYSYEALDFIPSDVPVDISGYKGELWFVFDTPLVSDSYGIAAYRNWSANIQTRAGSRAKRLLSDMSKDSDSCVQHSDIIYVKNKDKRVLGIILKVTIGKIDFDNSCSADLKTVYVNDRTKLVQDDVNWTFHEK